MSDDVRLRETCACGSALELDGFSIASAERIATRFRKDHQHVATPAPEPEPEQPADDARGDAVTTPVHAPGVDTQLGFYTPGGWPLNDEPDA